MKNQATEKSTDKKASAKKPLTKKDALTTYIALLIFSLVAGFIFSGLALAIVSIILLIVGAVRGTLSKDCALFHIANTVLACILVFIGLIALSFVYIDSVADTPYQPVVESQTTSGNSTTTPDYTVGIAQIIHEFSNNKVACYEKYANKNVEVTGVVNEVGLDFDNTPYVDLSDGTAYTFDIVRCRFMDSSSVASLNRGEMVTIKGIANKGYYWFTLENCKLG